MPLIVHISCLYMLPIDRVRETNNLSRFAVLALKSLILLQSVTVACFMSLYVHVASVCVFV